MGIPFVGEVNEVDFVASFFQFPNQGIHVLFGTSSSEGDLSGTDCNGPDLFSAFKPAHFIPDF